MTTAEIPDATFAIERQRAAIRRAHDLLAAFVASPFDRVDATSGAAESALRGALSAGASVERLAAEVEVSPRALRAILDGSVRLSSLHPGAGAHAG